jgi:PhoD-like phosphatase
VTPVPQLVLGPLLRYVGETEATIWVETDEACEVAVLNSRTPTFCVRGRHYAIAYVKGLEPGTRYEYTVKLDGHTVWPDPSSAMPPPSIRTPKEGERHRMIFGSCRVGYPHEPPYDLTKDQSPLGREVDALRAYALRMRDRPEEEWPHLLLMIGDQVYADEVPPHTKSYIQNTRDTSEGAGEEVANFDEYVRLYSESWGEPVIRWLLSTVSTAMIFDDHDVQDDWNTSQAWLEEQRAKPWWEERIAGAFMSYWLYQHLGNLSPRDHDADGLLQRARRVPDLGDDLHAYALRADREPTGARWTYCRDVANARVVVVDSRAGRVLEGTRKMLDDDEWDYVEQHATGDLDHLFIASSLPFLLPRPLHDLEAWNERVCDGAWGGPMASLGERIRQGVDLEHWAAFDDSFERVEGLLKAVASGERGDPPGTVTMLSGDVHFAYLAEVGFPRGTGAESNVWQAVCSPVRNPLDKREKAVVRFNCTRAAGVIGRALARSAGVRKPEIDWRLCEGPAFDNQVATIDWQGKHAELILERVPPGDSQNPELVETFRRTLA